MIRTKRAQQAKQITGINITPFTDVCLVLLIIFMVTASALTTSKNKVLQLNLPKSTTADVPMPKSLAVRITRDQQFYLNNTLVPSAMLGAKIKAFRTTYGSAQLVVEADEGVPYRLVIETIDTARKVGISQFALATRQPDATPTKMP